MHEMTGSRKGAGSRIFLKKFRFLCNEIHFFASYIIEVYFHVVVGESFEKIHTVSCK